MGKMLESRENFRSFCWAVLQMAWHLKIIQDMLAVKGYALVLFMLPYSLFCIVIPLVAELELSKLRL